MIDSTLINLFNNTVLNKCIFVHKKWIEVICTPNNTDAQNVQMPLPKFKLYPVKDKFLFSQQYKDTEIILKGSTGKCSKNGPNI